MAELVARIHALLRRTRPGGSGTAVADLVINEDVSRVERAGVGLDLTETERRLLGYLAAHREDVVSKAQILTAVWGYDGFDENVVEVHASSLRRKLEAEWVARGSCTPYGAAATGSEHGMTTAPTARPRRMVRPAQADRHRAAALQPRVSRLNTVSLRLRVTVATMAVLGVMMILLGVTVRRVSCVAINRSLDALLTGRAQLAQAARQEPELGPQMIVNRVEADGGTWRISSCATARSSAPRCRPGAPSRLSS